MKFPLRPPCMQPWAIRCKRQALNLPLYTDPRYTRSWPPLFTYRATYKAPPSMSSDEAYSSFLEQANQDTGASKAKTSTGPGSVGTKAVDTDVPATLQGIEQYYTSEADEPFEPVSLGWSGQNMPSESKLC